MVSSALGVYFIPPSESCPKDGLVKKNNRNNQLYLSKLPPQPLNYFIRSISVIAKSSLEISISSFAIDNTSSLKSIIENLHPTPAVCGFHTKEALRIIQSTEKHDRQYYSGFLGPVGMENCISLFVNLRCMRIAGNYLSLFTGAGITKDSVPNKEWKETEMKAVTLLSAINTMN